MSSETETSTRPIWVHPALAASGDRPHRKIHLDFHNSEYIPSIGEDFDADEFVETLKAASIDSIVVFGKDMHGYFYYPSEYGPVHPGLGGRDLMGEQIRACKAAGITVYVYYCTTWDNYLAEHHPEWLSFTRERESYLPKFDETPNWTALCLSNDDFVTLMLDHSREILEKYQPDGIWYDMPMPNRDVECFCANCLQAIRAEGKDPLDLNVQRERMQLLLNNWLRVSSEFTEKVLPGAGIEQNNQTRLGLTERAPYLENVEIEALPTGGWGYGYFSLMTRFVRGTGLPQTGQTGRFMLSWADFGGLKTANQLTLEVASIAATGADVCIGDQAPPSGRLDARVYRTIGAAYGSLAELDDYVHGAVGVAEAALYVAGVQLADFGRAERHGNSALREGALGASKLLIERGVQFDVVEAGTVDLSRYRLVVVAEGIDLTPEAIAELDNFVAAGGALVYSAYPGASSADLPWLSALGVTSAEASPFTPSYVRIADELIEDLDGFEYALYDGAERWTADGSSDAFVGGVLGEPLFQRAPEHYTSHHQSPVATITERPVVLVNDRIAAFAFPVASGYYRHGYWVYAALFNRVLDRMFPEQIVLSDAPPTLEVTVTHQDADASHGERWLVHLVNFSGGVRRGPEHLEYFDSVIPVHDVTLSFALPVDAATVRARTARGEVSLPVSAAASGRLSVTVPSVATHEIVVIE